MRNDLSIEFPFHFLLQGIECAKVDIFNASARKADEVVVMVPVRAEIIIELTVWMGDL